MVDDHGISPLFPYLGSRVRYSMGNISDKAPDISILYQSSDPFRNVIQKPHGIAKEVHRSQDPRCLAEEFLSRGGGRQEEEPPVYSADSVPSTEARNQPCAHAHQHSNHLSMLTKYKLLPFHKLHLSFSQMHISQRSPPIHIHFP